jgi:hypothetical protein
MEAIAGTATQRIPLWLQLKSGYALNTASRRGRLRTSKSLLGQRMSTTANQKPLHVGSDLQSDPASQEYEAFCAKLRFGNQGQESLDPGLSAEERELLGIPQPKVLDRLRSCRLLLRPPRHFCYPSTCHVQHAMPGFNRNHIAELVSSTATT